jgi:anaerobic ribonucleoside-triphosphate reductase activating protein
LLREQGGKMRIARIIDKTEAEGPGLRFTIWLQGCPHHCIGCYAKDMWPFEGGTQMSIDEIFGRIKSVSNEIEGVTFLGGEPLAQAAELSKLLKKIKNIGLSVTIFTGYVYEYIERYGSKDQKEVLKMTDLLIDGPYDEKKRNFTRPLVGSDNQRFLFLTERYSMKDIEKLVNRIEVRIDPLGVIRMNGMGDFPELTSMLQGMGMMYGGRE